MSNCYVGIDLGGTNIAGGVASEDGCLLRTASAPTRSEEGPEAILARIAELGAELAQGRLLGLGVGVPGLVDTASGVTKFLPNLPTQWRDVAAGEYLRSKLGCPVRLLNDCRTAALGELQFGAGRNYRDLALFMIGTGIGGGVILDGQVRLGALGAAGELGHQTILPDGPLCGCGNRGCLETLASGPAIAGEGVRLMRSGLAPKLFELTAGNAEAVTPKSMAEAARLGDRAVEASIARIAGYLGIGVANVIVTVHPQLVVIGGGVAAMGDLLLEPLRRTVKDRVGMLPPETVAIEPSPLGDQSGIYGAVALAMTARE
ncbi:MAG: ROK family protein [Bryobacterales bacterium]|nr:ROK family protein [Bryobacterales bacterium]